MCLYPTCVSGARGGQKKTNKKQNWNWKPEEGPTDA